MSILKKISDTNKIIKYLIHLADIHIRRTNERLEEYKQVFLNLEKDLLDRDLNPDNSLIVICGDIFHDKELLSPISVELCKYFFNMLSNITNIIVIPGNHDIVENNQDINSLKAVISKYFQSKNKIYYIDENCNYIYNNLILSNTNVFSDKVTEYIHTDKYSDKKLIQLYHGIILGCQNESNSFLGDDKNFRIGDFRKYNKEGYILLGDIHKRQKLDNRCAYSGSLIQQNKGESSEKGYILWDLEKDKSKFINIKNDYGYIKVVIEKDGKTNLNLECLPKYTKLNIISKSTKLEHIDNFCKLIDKKSKIIERNQYFDMSENSLNTTLEINGKKNNMTLTNKDSLFNLIIDGIKQIGTNIDKNIEDKIKLLINDIKFVDISVKNIKLKTLKFNNFMKYGENNMINFENLKDFYSIFAKNSAGKSTLYDCIIYSIFGISSRGTAYDMINKDSKIMDTEITLSINEKEYKIIRRISKHNEKAQTIKTDILNIFENNVNIAYDVRKSSKIIEEKICTYEEFIRNSIVAQHIDVNFMNLSPKEKINYLSNISRLEIIKQITNNCTTILRGLKKDYTQNQNKLSKYKEYDLIGKNNIIEIKTNLENCLKEHIINKEKILKNINYNEAKLNDINKSITIQEHDIHILEKKILNYGEYEINDNMYNIDIDKITDNKYKLERYIEYNVFELEKLESKKILLYCDMIMGDYELKNKIFEKTKNNKINEINEIIKSKQKLLWNDNTFNYDEYIRDDILDEIEESNELIKDYSIRLKDKEDMIKKIDKMTKQKINKIDFDMEKYNSKILEKNNIQNKINQLKNDIENINETYNKLKNHKYDPKCKYCIDNGITKQKILLENMIKENNISIKSNNDKLNELDGDINIMNKLKIKYDEYINKIEIINDSKNELDNVNKDIEVLKMKIDKENNEIKKNKEIIRKIDLYENNKNINNEIDKYLIEIEKIKNKGCDEYKKYLEMNKEYNKIIEDIHNLNNKIIKLNNEYDVNKKKIEEYTKYETSINDISIINKNISDLQIKLDCNLNKKNKLIEDIDKNKKELEKIESKIIKCNIDTESFNNLFTELNIQYKDINEYEIISKFVCDDELITKILKNNIIPQIETLINNILLNCSTYQLSFQFYKDNIDIYKKENNSDTITNISTCGAFERHTLNLLFRIVFSQITGLIKTDFIIIDEAFDSSDMNNREKIKNIIDYMKSKYKWGIIISHDCYVKDNFDKEITIQNKDGIPYVNI
jgi:DNA repair exonuclease SbcCD ATPase subunit